MLCASVDDEAVGIYISPRVSHDAAADCSSTDRVLLIRDQIPSQDDTSKTQQKFRTASKHREWELQRTVSSLVFFFFRLEAKGGERSIHNRFAVCILWESIRKQERPEPGYILNSSHFYKAKFSSRETNKKLIFSLLKII
jgi:hypothetical protein